MLLNSGMQEFCLVFRPPAATNKPLWSKLRYLARPVGVTAAAAGRTYMPASCKTRFFL